MDSGSGTGPSTSGAATTILNKYTLGRLLGRGSFAKVYLATPLTGPNQSEPVAIKIIDKLKLDPEMCPRVVREIIAMRRLNHPNILTIHEVLATKSKIYLVMELARGGDLFSKLARRPGHRFPERLARLYFQQLISALQFCHLHGVAHRDVKPQNILLDEDGNVKLSDFGLSAVTSLNLLDTACGTPAFAAPEVVSRKGYDGAKSDSWSCGVILYAMLVGGLPFDDSNLVRMYRKMHKREYQLPSNLTRGAKGLIQGLLDPNPTTRLGIEEITSNPWFKTSQFGTRSMSLGDLASLDGSSSEKLERVSSMNAFDIIGMGSGLDLSGMFEGEGRKERRFTTKDLGAEAVVERVEEVGRGLGDEVEKGKGGKIWLGKGRLVLMVEALEMAPEVLVVEVRVADGSGGGRFGKVQWEELKSGLGDIVAFWHNEET